NSGTNSVSVLPGTSTGAFLPASLTIPTGDGPGTLAVGNFDGNSVPDFVTANFNDGTLSLLLGQVGGTYQSIPLTPEKLSTPFQGRGGGLRGDGKDDLAVIFVGSNQVDVLFGRGDGTFESPVALDGGPNPAAIAAGHVFGNDRLDLITANDNGIAVIR